MDFLKEMFLVGPSGLPYNLNSPDKYNGQHGQPKAIDKILGNK